MGVFAAELQVTKPRRRPRRKTFRRVVDSGSEMTRLPESELRAVGVEVFKRDQLFVMADGQYVTRNVGMAVIEFALLLDDVIDADLATDCNASENSTLTRGHPPVPFV